MRLICLGLLVFVLLPITIGKAENWPQFRGPDGQGHTSATGLPTKWSATENALWKKDIPGIGWSSPVLWDEAPVCHRRPGRVCKLPTETGPEPGWQAAPGWRSARRKDREAHEEV